MTMCSLCASSSAMVCEKIRPCGEVMTMCPPPIASTARSTGSASITIPGPPPYASSSVERCLSDAKSRRSHTRASSSPCFTPRPMMPSASSGSNMLGKMVTKSNLIETFRQVDDDTLPAKVDVDADLRNERHVVAAAVALDVQQQSSRPLLGVHDFPALAPLGIDERESDKVVQKVLVLF